MSGPRSAAGNLVATIGQGRRHSETTPGLTPWTTKKKQQRAKDEEPKSAEEKSLRDSRLAGLEGFRSEDLRDLSY